MMVYLGKPASDLDADKVTRGYTALARMEHQLAATRFLIGDSRSPMFPCSPIRASRMKAVPISMATLRCGAGSASPNGNWGCSTLRCEASKLRANRNVSDSEPFSLECH
jgi:hypothetical protein